jgi:hypothetical protein
MMVVMVPAAMMVVSMIMTMRIRRVAFSMLMLRMRCAMRLHAVVIAIVMLMVVGHTRQHD